MSRLVRYLIAVASHSPSRGQQRIRGLELLTLSFLLVAAACGGDSGTEPSNASISGNWRFTWTNMSATVSGTTLVCSGVLDFSITQSGGTFSGTQQGNGTTTCLAGGQTVVDEVVNGETLINGQLAGNQVSFRLGSIVGTHTGTVSGTSMLGTAAWQFDVGGGTTVNMNGQWSAAKR